MGFKSDFRGAVGFIGLYVILILMALYLVGGSLAPFPISHNADNDDDDLVGPLEVVGQEGTLTLLVDRDTGVEYYRTADGNLQPRLWPDGCPVYYNSETGEIE